MQHILVHSKMNGLRPLLTAPPVFAFRQLRGNFHDLHKRLPGTYRVYLSRLLQSRYTKIQNCVWDVRRFILLTNLVID